MIVADMVAVIKDAKTALASAEKISMNLDGVDVRQISVSSGSEKLATVVTRNADNLHRLLLVNYESGDIVASQEEITSAVFSADSKFIVAGRDSRE